MDLEAFELVLLRTPENSPAYDDAALQRIQKEHLAHHARLRATGEVVTNGPAARSSRGSLLVRDEVIQVGGTDQVGVLTVIRSPFALRGRQVRARPPYQGRAR